MFKRMMVVMLFVGAIGAASLLTAGNAEAHRHRHGCGYGGYGYGGPVAVPVYRSGFYGAYPAPRAYSARYYGNPGWYGPSGLYQSGYRGNYYGGSGIYIRF